ncbi:uncharacterized protein RCC_09245 [Ramularia collo-cygni]|uniref:F-box domain-containing protein n=1 Tax=Ramularia collo-cygni TaxID=112498 RepID=A0A2D3VH75_9PEZI|nr:uncharacterized protein RCC_09245 [Ramularia collo-cygni]CZT23531.1 uncharacterized protein RCC_09245 [Ramularia collo-cygni]
MSAANEHDEVPAATRAEDGTDRIGSSPPLVGDPTATEGPSTTEDSPITGNPSTTVTSVIAQPQLRHPFYTLPAELILDIVDYLPADAFINFAFANYPLLNSYGLAPALSRPRILYITTRTRIPALFPLLRMPPEIMLHIMRHLKPIDIMRFVVANYQDLARQGIAPALTPETILQLRNAIRVRLLGGATGDAS